MIIIRLSLFIAATAAVSLASAPVYAQTPSAGVSEFSTSASAAIYAGAAHAKADAGTPKRLSDAQMDKTTAGLGFDTTGFSSALDAWLGTIQTAINNYDGTPAHLTLLTGCTAAGCAAGTPPPNPASFFK
jgi:hypothetical protein